MQVYRRPASLGAGQLGRARLGGVVVAIRAVEPDDLEEFFVHQLDPEAVRCADFPSRDRRSFFEHWTKRVLDNSDGVARTVLADGEVAGNIVCWLEGQRWRLGYWYGREFWGRGVATEALGLFLGAVATRPFYADTAETNIGSIRVLEKCGFRRLPEVEIPGEILFMLDYQA
jgi:RimJ/RimL family protein N-acetyltransferase